MSIHYNVYSQLTISDRAASSKTLLFQNDYSWQRSLSYGWNHLQLCKRLQFEQAGQRFQNSHWSAIRKESVLQHRAVTPENLCGVVQQRVDTSQKPFGATAQHVGLVSRGGVCSFNYRDALCWTCMAQTSAMWSCKCRWCMQNIHSGPAWKEDTKRKDNTSPLNVIKERANWLEQSPKPSSAPHGYQLEAKLDMTCT